MKNAPATKAATRKALAALAESVIEMTEPAESTATRMRAATDKSALLNEIVGDLYYSLAEKDTDLTADWFTANFTTEELTEAAIFTDGSHHHHHYQFPKVILLGSATMTAQLSDGEAVKFLLHGRATLKVTALSDCHVDVLANGESKVTAEFFGRSYLELYTDHHAQAEALVYSNAAAHISASGHSNAAIKAQGLANVEVNATFNASVKVEASEMARVFMACTSDTDITVKSIEAAEINVKRDRSWSGNYYISSNSNTVKLL